MPLADLAGRANELAVEMAREGTLVGELALADLLEEHGRPDQAEGVRRGTLVPLVAPGGRAVFLHECPGDDPAVVGGPDDRDWDYIDLT